MLPANTFIHIHSDQDYRKDMLNPSVLSTTAVSYSAMTELVIDGTSKVCTTVGKFAIASHIRKYNYGRDGVLMEIKPPMHYGCENIFSNVNLER